MIEEMSNDVVVVRAEFTSKGFARGKIEHGAGCRNICLNQHDAPGAMEHAQREAALRAGDLVVIELHRIDGPAAEFVVLRIRPEDRTQQDASATSLYVSFHMILVYSLLLGKVLRSDLGHTFEDYYTRSKQTPENKIVPDGECIRDLPCPVCWIRPINGAVSMGRRNTSSKSTCRSLKS